MTGRVRVERAQALVGAGVLFRVEWVWLVTRPACGCQAVCGAWESAIGEANRFVEIHALAAAFLAPDAVGE